ncbi:unnamed protein product [Lactuca virosa]|uniref:Uncharacterized protein n=1 Tax=Lactuca virosa TaxID=75947 RepID=A0AAU9N0F2_9ASTR|nr:unnamed protein product [Lactuca virosa]
MNEVIWFGGRRKVREDREECRSSFEHQLLDKNPQRKIWSRLCFYLDVLATAKKLTSNRKEQLIKLHKYFLNMREYSDKLKRCEDQLQVSRYEHDKKVWVAAVKEVVQAMVAQCEHLKVKYNKEQIKGRKLHNQFEDIKETGKTFTMEVEPTNDSPSKLSSPGITTWAKSLKLPQPLGGTQDESSSSENTPTMIMRMDVSSSGKLPSLGWYIAKDLCGVYLAKEQFSLPINK